MVISFKKIPSGIFKYYRTGVGLMTTDSEDDSRRKSSYCRQKKSSDFLRPGPQIYNIQHIHILKTKNPLAQKSMTEDSFQYKILDYIICGFFS